MDGLFERIWDNRKVIERKFTNRYSRALREEHGDDYLSEFDLYAKELKTALSPEDYNKLAELMKQQDDMIDTMARSAAIEKWLDSGAGGYHGLGDFVASQKDLAQFISKEPGMDKLAALVAQVNAILAKVKVEEKKVSEGTIPNDKDNEPTKIKKLMEDEDSCKDCSGPLSRCPSCTNMSYCEKCKKCRLHPIVQTKKENEAVNEQEEEEKRPMDTSDETPDFDGLHDKMKDNSEEDGTPKDELPPEEPGESEAAKEKEVPEKEYLGKTDDDTFFYLNHGDDVLHITDAEGKIVYPKAADKEENKVEDELPAAGEEPIPDTEELQFIIKAQQELEMTEISADILTRYVQPALDVVEKEREEEEGFEFETPPGEGGPAGETPGEEGEEAAEGETPGEEAEEGPEGEAEEEEEELDADGKPKPKKKKIGMGEQPITIESKANKELQKKGRAAAKKNMEKQKRGEAPVSRVNPKESIVNEVKVLFNGHTYDVMMENDMGEGGIHIRINGHGPYHFTAPFVEMFGRDKNGGLTEDSIKELGQSALSAMNSEHLEKVSSMVAEAKEKTFTCSGCKEKLPLAQMSYSKGNKNYCRKCKNAGKHRKKDESKVEALHNRLTKIAEARLKEDFRSEWNKEKNRSGQDPAEYLESIDCPRCDDSIAYDIKGSGTYWCEECNWKGPKPSKKAKKEGKIPDDKDNEQTKIKKLMEMKKKLSERAWKYKIYLPFLEPIFYGDQEEYDVGVLGAKVSKALEQFIATKPRLPDMVIQQIEEIKEEFDNLEATGDTEEDNMQFNSLFQDLYDLGDKHSIWVDTMTRPGETPAGEEKKPPQEPEKKASESKVQEEEEKKDKTEAMNELIKRARELISKGKAMDEKDYSELGQLTGEMSKHMSLGLHTASEKAVAEALVECKIVLEARANEKIGMDDIEEFESIQGQIKDLAQQALDIVKRSGDRMAYERARSYWYPHIIGNLGEEFGEGYSGSMTNMDDTLKELRMVTDEGGREQREDDEERRNRTGTKESIKEGADAVGRLDAFRDGIEAARTAAHQIDHDLMKISNKRLANKFLTFVTTELRNLTTSKAWKLYNAVEAALKAGPVDPKDKKDDKGKKDDKKTDESITEDTDTAKIEPFKSDTELASAIRKDIMAEQEAIALYQTHAEATTNAQAKKLLTDIGEEEQVHVGELTKLLSTIQPKDDNLHSEGEEEAEDKMGSKEEKPEVEEAKKEETPKDKLINPAFCSKCGKAMKADDLVNGMSKCCSALTSLDAPLDKDDGKGNLTEDPQEEEPVSTEEVDKAVKAKVKETTVDEMLSHLDGHQNTEGVPYEERF